MKIGEILKLRLHRTFISLSFFDFSKLISFFEVVIFGLLFLLTSGYSMSEFVFSNRVVAIILVVLTLLSFALFLLNINVVKVKEMVATKKIGKPTFSSLFLIALVLLFGVSSVFNASNGLNINGIIRLICLFLSCFFFVATVSFDSFTKYFARFFSIVCCISLIFFAFSFIAPSSFAFSVYITDKDTIVYNYGLVCFVLRAANYRSAISNRMAGPFWEPSIFAAVLSLALLCVNLSQIKNKYIYWIIFVLCLLLTQSTGGIALGVLSFLVLLFRDQPSKKRLIRMMLLLLLCVVFGLLILFFLGFFKAILPSIFSKFDFSSVTFTTRLLSPYYFILVFLKEPVLGLGPQVALSTYSSIVDSVKVDSATSSFGFFIASFGAAGILFVILIAITPFFVKRWNMSTRIIVACFLLLVFNLENISYLSIFLLFTCYLQKEALFGPSYLEEATPESDKGKAFLFSKTEDGSLTRNLNGSLLVKGASLIIGVIAVPIYNRYFVSDDLYGAWLTVISVLSWTLLFDFGFGSGLRSKLGQAIDGKDDSSQKSLISSAYLGTIAISLVFLTIVLFFVWSIDINALINVSEGIIGLFELRVAMTVLAIGLFFEFILKNVVYIFYAWRRSAIAASFALISNSALLFFFIVFSNFSFEHRFLIAALVYALTVNIPLLVATIIFFSQKKHRFLAPRLSSFNWATCKSVMSIGIAFFAVQIGFFILSQTDSFLVSNLFSSSDVVLYTKYSKIFTFFIGLMGAVVQQPIWSAVSAAASARDKRSIKKYLKICFIISGLLSFFCLISGVLLQLIFNVWLGSYSLDVNYSFVVVFVFYSFSYCFSDALIIVCNGLLIVKGQAIVTLLAAAAKIVLVFSLCLSFPGNALSWCLIVLIDGICYVPYLFVLPFLIKKKLNTMSEGGI